MLQRQNILRTFLFVFFFSIGAAALTVAILAGDLRRYYYNKNILKSKDQILAKLKDLDTDYDVLLKQLEKDPDLVKRLVPIMLGTKTQQEENTAYPKAKAKQLAAAKKALTENQNPKTAEPNIPNRVTRCYQPSKRVMLLICGAALILISFICFSPIKGTAED